MANNSVEKGASTETNIETAAIAVNQPQKLEGLMDTINLLNTVSDRIGEDRSGDWSGSGGQQGDDTTGAGQGQSARDQAIANLPTGPVMQKQLEKHIRAEVKTLRKEIRRVSKRANKAGSAHKLNELYMRVRRLNSLLSELLSSSVEVVKRIYVRIFVDKQPVF